MRIEKQLERRLQSPHLNINKVMVLSNLKKSFYNNTFLAKQKRLKDEIDRNMTMLGLNLEVFKFQAQQMLRKKRYN